MKTSELIRRLQEADPNDEAECCVDNDDIHFLEVIPAYYDGRLQVFTRDQARAPYFDITGAKITGSGTKIKIRHLSVEELLIDHPEMPVDISTTGSARSNAESAEEVEKWRATGRRFCARVYDHPDDQDASEKKLADVIIRLEAWLAAIRAATDGSDVPKVVKTMTARALSGEPANPHSVDLLSAYRARALACIGSNEPGQPGSAYGKAVP